MLIFLANKNGERMAKSRTQNGQPRKPRGDAVADTTNGELAAVNRICDMVAKADARHTGAVRHRDGMPRIPRQRQVGHERRSGFCRVVALDTTDRPLLTREGLTGAEICGGHQDRTGVLVFETEHASVDRFCAGSTRIAANRNRGQVVLQFTCH